MYIGNVLRVRAHHNISHAIAAIIAVFSAYTSVSTA